MHAISVFYARLAQTELHLPWNFGQMSRARVGLRVPLQLTNRIDWMTKGTVKWFNPVKGYGFITPEDGGKDAFVHISAVERAGLSELKEGQQVEYELQPGKNGKSSAENLKIAD